MAPTIILTFANDKDNYLNMLVTERKSIYSALQELNDQQLINVYKEENTSVDDIFDTFLRFDNEIVIFHYGGHANGTQLQLERGAGNSQKAFAKGLASLMGQQKKLVFVFLNGCATLGHVDLLLNSGVKAVIATSVPVNDEMAVDFAGQFYKKLASDAPLLASFNFAKSYIYTTYGDQRPITQHRDIDFNDSKPENAPKELPWGLYYKTENQDILAWKISDANKGTIPPEIQEEIAKTRNYISNANTKKAFEIFKKMAEKNIEITDKVNLINARFNRTKSDEMLGIISFADATREFNIINNSLLQLLQEFESSFLS